MNCVAFLYSERTGCICGYALVTITSLDRTTTGQNWQFKDWTLMQSTWLSDQSELPNTHKTYIVKHSLIVNKTHILSPFDYMVENLERDEYLQKFQGKKENTAVPLWCYSWWSTWLHLEFKKKKIWIYLCRYFIYWIIWSGQIILKSRSFEVGNPP